MNKELYKKEIIDKIKEVKLGEEMMTIHFESGKDLSIGSYHSQECCEHVYGDFSIVQYYPLAGKATTEIVIKGVEGMGFLVCIQHDYSENTKIFIPCYNYQNGYYSSELQLKLKIEDVETTVDISDLVEENIG